MRNKLAIAALAALATATTAVPEAALAKHYYNNGYNNNGNYHGQAYRHRCRSGNGAVGTVAGGAGGALVGNALGGGTLGTVAGGVGGALLGRHLDKKNTRHRNGC